MKLNIERAKQKFWNMVYPTSCILNYPTACARLSTIGAIGVELVGWTPGEETIGTGCTDSAKILCPKMIIYLSKIKTYAGLVQWQRWASAQHSHIRHKEDGGRIELPEERLAKRNSKFCERIWLIRTILVVLSSPSMNAFICLFSSE